MVHPSQKWLNKFSETLVPETFVRITYGLTEPGLQEDATPSTSGETVFSNIVAVTKTDDVNYNKYSTGELNFSVLDGTYQMIQASNQKEDAAGYVSERCVSDQNHPIVTFSFSRIHTVTIPGVTITWSSVFDEYARSFKLTAYSGNDVVSTKVVSDNESVLSEIDWEISGYDSISIEIIAWCVSDRRARVESVKFGHFIVFEKGSILSYTHESSRDPISGQLPNDNVTFSIDNSEQKWSPINPKGLYKYLYERQPISVQYGMDIDGATEWIDGGKFYLSEWNVPSNGIEANFVARDIFSYLMVSNYTGRMYGTLYEMAYDALELLNYNATSFRISDELKSYNADIASKSKNNYKDSDILQMVANAAGMAMYQTRDGIIVIDRIPDIANAKANLAGEIEIVNNFEWPEISFSAPLKNVTCTINTKNETGDQTESKTFSYPESTPVDGATQTVSNEMLSENILSQPKNVLTEAYKVLSNRKKVSLNYRASPHFDALDYVLIHHQFDYTSIMLTTRFSYKYSGCFHGTVEGYMLEGENTL